MLTPDQLDRGPAVQYIHRVPMTAPVYTTWLGPTQTWAFTVRPDLWPPGSRVANHDWAPGGRPTGFSLSAPWAWHYTSLGTTTTRANSAAEANREVPGVAEAAILAGQVHVASTDDWSAGQVWRLEW